MLFKKFIDKIYCINLKKRIDRKKEILKHTKKLSLNINFFEAIEHKNGALGCLLSHIKIIELAKKRNLRRIMIIEDDCVFKTNKLEFNSKNLPDDWEMLYLGGDIADVYEDKTNKKFLEKEWIKMKCYSTHCYIIGKQSYDIILEKLNNHLDNNFKPIDVIYKDEIHSRQKSYILKTQPAHQLDTYSDIEQKYIKYLFKTPEYFVAINKLKLNQEENGDLSLYIKKNYDDEDLPHISIVTPTKNRKKIFELAIHNFQSFDYPRDKLEWVIVDDSDNGDNLVDILPKDSRIRYIKINISKQIGIGTKRNLCIKYAKYDYIMQMDDDDYYYPTAIRSMAEVLLDNPQYDVVCCSTIYCYNVKSDNYNFCGDGISPAEATMMFKKSFHQERPYSNFIIKGEGTNFIVNRKDRVIQIPNEFVIIVINHNQNLTDNLRQHCQVVEHGYKLPENIMKIIKKIHT